MITIIDYKTGNIGSIQNMLKKLRVESVITSDPEIIASSTKIILPGVGAFDLGMSNLEKLNLIPVLNRKVREDNTPVLGICLGMQLMTRGSEEGILPGLGWIDGRVIKFRISDTRTFKIPHMGWNFISQRKSSRLFSGMIADPRFYFVHSYHVELESNNDMLTSTIYENEFVSSFEKDNLVGVQFHPEKSHKFGMILLKNFVELY